MLFQVSTADVSCHFFLKMTVNTQSWTELSWLYKSVTDQSDVHGQRSGDGEAKNVGRHQEEHHEEVDQGKPSERE